MIGKIIGKLGATLWETNGFWIDRENDIVQEDYSKLPLMGKVGYQIMVTGLKMEGIEYKDLWD